MQTLSIGVISQMIPKDILEKDLFLKFAVNIFWFNEIEAVYAFLLQAKLDHLLIEQGSDISSNEKYQKLFMQMHPEIKISKISSKELNQEISFLANQNQKDLYNNSRDNALIYYPKLEELFNSSNIKSVYQPIIRKDTNKLKFVGIECLSRFSFHEYNYPPEILFHYAQEKLKLYEYDRLCLYQALKKAPKNNDLLIFVNVRPQTLINSDFSPWLTGLLKDISLDPKKIVIEITEQQCIVSEEKLLKECQKMVLCGFSFALDDFGTGISNFSLLEIMRPKFIKISGRFISGIRENRFRKSIVQHILMLANNLNINCIAENVENEGDWLALEELGANMAQGFHFYKPVECKEIEALLLINI